MGSETPSHSPPGLIQTKASASSEPVSAEGRLPKPTPCWLHQWPHSFWPVGCFPERPDYVVVCVSLQSSFQALVFLFLLFFHPSPPTISIQYYSPWSMMKCADQPLAARRGAKAEMYFFSSQLGFGVCHILISIRADQVSNFNRTIRIL